MSNGHDANITEDEIAELLRQQPIERTVIKSEAIANAYVDIDNDFTILEQNIRSVAERLRDQADYLDKVANAVALRKEQAKAELSSHSDFREDALRRTHDIRQLSERIDGVFHS